MPGRVSAGGLRLKLDVLGLLGGQDRLGHALGEIVDAFLLLDDVDFYGRRVSGSVPGDQPAGLVAAAESLRRVISAFIMIASRAASASLLDTASIAFAVAVLITS